MRNSVLPPPFIRNFLIKLNRDIDQLSNYCPSTHEETPESGELPIHRMVLLLEDRRFFSHSGVDIWSLKRECFRFLTLQRHGGASTIDMQLVRTITGYRERTPTRKIYEMFLARLLQYHATKWQILNSYLSIAYFGNRLRGIEATSQKLFNKNKEDLTLEEAAELASLLVYPRPQNETPRWREKVTRRASYALRLNTRLKKISK